MASVSMDVDSAAEPNPRSSAHELLEETHASMEAVAARLLFLKKDARPKQPDLRDLLTQTSLLFITLRQANREILLEEDRVKTETETAKAPVDFATLQLHNLLYEKNHYVKAIKACKDFRSKYPDIELVPEEDFFRSAPEEIRGKVLASDPAHDLMLKRLNFELFQRKELCKLHEKLEQHKSTLLDAIATQKRFLSSLPSHLKSLKKASLPVQQQLGILHTKKLKQYHAAELLPPPLYIAYSQLLAQKEAFGEKIDMEIIGSTKEAQTFAQQQANKDNGLQSYGENKRLEDDALDEEDDAQRRRTRSKKNSVKEATNQSGICQVHPLKIILDVYDDEDSDAKSFKLLTLRFEYSVNLHVLCVGVEDAEGSDDNILCNLFPDDTGTELPSQTAKLYAGKSLAFSERISRPYKWAQHLAGIDFLPEQPPSHLNSEIPISGTAKRADVSSGLALYRHQNRVQTILQRIRSRKRAQMALMEQLDSLTKLRWPPLVYSNTPWAQHTPLCSLHGWSTAGLISDSSAVVVAGDATVGVDSGLDRRSVTHWEEAESTREDGELPMAPSVESNGSSEATDHSRSLSLISKIVAHPKKSISRTLSRIDDHSELMMDSESELDEQTVSDPETETVNFMVVEPWEDCSSKEFRLVLYKTLGSDRIIKLEAKVKISKEYPIRPPFFSLSLLPEGDQGLKWYNTLRALEAEVNLHILKVLPVAYENYILAHQVRCLAMLFDFHFDDRHDKRKTTSLIDVGLCEPISGSILARSVRGRDRRTAIYWKH